MLDRLNLPTLQQRREIDRLVNMFKIVGGMVPAINADEYFIHQRAKRHIKARQFENFQSTNIVEKSVVNSSKGYIVPNSNTEQFRNSFFVKTVIQWNHLDESVVTAETVEGFKLDMRGPGDYLRPIDIAMPPNQSNDTINSFFTLPHTCSAVHFLDIYFSSLPYQKKKQKFQTPYF